MGSAEKWIGFAFGTGIFSLPRAFAERGGDLAIADALAFAFPFPLAISRRRSDYLCGASREERDETPTSPSFFMNLAY